jgi:hypothetical protein
LVLIEDFPYGGGGKVNVAVGNGGRVNVGAGSVFVGAGTGVGGIVVFVGAGGGICVAVGACPTGACVVGTRVFVGKTMVKLGVTNS